MKTSLILPRTSNQPIFYKLFGGNFCEQQLMLGKLLNTVKWSNFCVSFICVLTILVGYGTLKSLKSVTYLVTSNVQFGTVSINPVTNDDEIWSIISSGLLMSFLLTSRITPHSTTIVTPLCTLFLNREVRTFYELTTRNVALKQAQQKFQHDSHAH